MSNGWICPTAGLQTTLVHLSICNSISKRCVAREATHLSVFVYSIDYSNEYRIESYLTTARTEVGDKRAGPLEPRVPS